jgi:hypothetical protein
MRWAPAVAAQPAGIEGRDALPPYVMSGNAAYLTRAAGYGPGSRRACFRHGHAPQPV